MDYLELFKAIGVGLFYFIVISFIVYLITEYS
jgi:preprotein translocase subunit Sss1